MRRTYKIGAVAASLLLGAVLCAAEIPAAKDLPRPSGRLPAEIKIEAARAAIRANPKAHEPLNALAHRAKTGPTEVQGTSLYSESIAANNFIARDALKTERAGYHLGGLPTSCRSRIKCDNL